MDLMVNYVRQELLVLVPVLYWIGLILKNSKINDKHIPILLGIISIILCGIYIFATSDSDNILLMVYSILTQGLLVAGCSVYANQIKKQSSKNN